MESAVTSVVSAITAGGFTSGNIATVFIAGLGIALPLVLTWFGIRFVWGKAKKAFTRGK